MEVLVDTQVVAFLRTAQLFRDRDGCIVEVEAQPGLLILRATDGITAIADAFEIPGQSSLPRGTLSLEDVTRIARLTKRKVAAPFQVELGAPFPFDFELIMRGTDNATLDVADLRSVLRSAAPRGPVVVLAATDFDTLVVTCEAFEAQIQCEHSRGGMIGVNVKKLLQALRTAPEEGTISLGFQPYSVSASFSDSGLRVALMPARCDFEHPITGELVQA